jgi:hypothetical protein
MFSLIPDNYHIQDAMQICIWFLLFGLAVAAQTAHSEESVFATENNTLTAKVVNSDIHRQLPYRFNSNVALNHPNYAVPTGLSSTPRLSFFTEPKDEDSWSINIQQQAPSSSNCSSSSLTCFDSKDDQLNDAKSQHNSFWFVLRKAFHF